MRVVMQHFSRQFFGRPEFPLTEVSLSQCYLRFSHVFRRISRTDQALKQLPAIGKLTLRDVDVGQSHLIREDIASSVDARIELQLRRCCRLSDRVQKSNQV